MAGPALDRFNDWLRSEGLGDGCLVTISARRPQVVDVSLNCSDGFRGKEIALMVQDFLHVLGRLPGTGEAESVKLRHSARHQYRYGRCH